MTWNLEMSLVSDTGCVREANEDSGRIVQPSDVATCAARGVLVIVADGMGGHAAGDVASRLAVDTINRAYYDSPGDPGSALTSALVAANRAIFAHASSDRGLTGMGTTCVALAYCGGLAYASHVGDSRLYLLREGAIYQMTRDDSAVGQMVQQGLLSREDARHHEDRNILLKALGTHAGVAVSQWHEPFPVCAGDAFVLCSDGLTDLVHDAEILEAVSTGVHPSEAAQSLVERAKSRGGFDNITVAVLRFTPQPVERTVAPETREAQVTT